jgi:hypothetical protein
VLLFVPLVSCWVIIIIENRKLLVCFLAQQMACALNYNICLLVIGAFCDNFGAFAGVKSAFGNAIVELRLKTLSKVVVPAEMLQEF